MNKLTLLTVFSFLIAMALVEGTELKNIDVIVNNGSVIIKSESFVQNISTAAFQSYKFALPIQSEDCPDASTTKTDLFVAKQDLSTCKMEKEANTKSEDELANELELCEKSSKLDIDNLNTKIENLKVCDYAIWQQKVDDGKRNGDLKVMFLVILNAFTAIIVGLIVAIKLKGGKANDNTKPHLKKC